MKIYVLLTYSMDDFSHIVGAYLDKNTAEKNKKKSYWTYEIKEVKLEE